MAIDRGLERESGPEAGRGREVKEGPGQLGLVPLANGGVRSARYTMAQVQAHSTEDDCWVVVAGKVYDATPWLRDHPGGADTILRHAGTAGVVY